MRIEPSHPKEILHVPSFQKILEDTWLQSGMTAHSLSRLANKGKITTLLCGCKYLSLAPIEDLLKVTWDLFYFEDNNLCLKKRGSTDLGSMLPLRQLNSAVWFHIPYLVADMGHIMSFQAIKLFLQSFNFSSPQLRNNWKFTTVSFVLSLPYNWVLYNIVWMQQQQQTKHICKCICYVIKPASKNSLSQFYFLNVLLAWRLRKDKEIKPSVQIRTSLSQS